MNVALSILALFNTVLAVIPKTGEHFYTTSQTEADNAVKNLGFILEGIAGNLYSSPNPPAIPLYRLYNGILDRHFYTTNEGERSSLLKGGWSSEGVAGYCFPESTMQGGGEPLYRLYNGAIFDHLYTTSFAEASSVQNIGYKPEGLACNLPAPGDGAVPFLRLYRKCLAGQDASANCSPLRRPVPIPKPPQNPPLCATGFTYHAECSSCLSDVETCCGLPGEVSGACSKTGCINGCCCDINYCEDENGNLVCPGPESILAAKSTKYINTSAATSISSKIDSISSALQTTKGSASTSLSSALHSASSALETATRISSSSSRSSTSSSTGVGAMPTATAAAAVGALICGAAVLVNM